MNYKMLSLVASCALVILLHAAPIRGIDTPQLPLEVYAPEFAAILGERPKLMLLATGFGFTEGPVYFSDTDDSSGYLIFTDQLNGRSSSIRKGQKPFRFCGHPSRNKVSVLRIPGHSFFS